MSEILKQAENFGVESIPVEAFEADAAAIAQTAPHSPKAQQIIETLQQPPLPAPSRLDAELTEQGNAEKLAKQYGENLRYDSDNDWWLWWNGKHWEIDKRGRNAMQCAIANAKEYLTLGGAPGTDVDAARRYAAHGKKSLQNSSLNATLSLAKHLPGMMASTANDFDQQHDLLNVANGTIDLRTGELLPHAREHYQIKYSPVEYDPAATAPKWEAFLKSIFDERSCPDQSFLDFIQRAVGYTLTGHTREQVLFILYGHGSNGKSTFLRILDKITDSYGKTAAPETLMMKRQGGVPNDVADLCGARFVSSIETENSQKMAQSLIKTLTGGDRVKARFLRREFFEFMPTFKIWLACNHKPVIDGSDDAIIRRIRLIPFNVQFWSREERPDVDDLHIKNSNLEAELLAELPGILNWMIQGARNWYRLGLGTHEQVKAATAAYASEMDSVLEFVNERCLTGEDFATRKTRASELIGAYTAFCSEMNTVPVGGKGFKERLSKLGVSNGRDKRGAFYQGIVLDSMPDDDLPPM